MSNGVTMFKVEPKNVFPVRDLQKKIIRDKVFDGKVIYIKDNSKQKGFYLVPEDIMQSKEEDYDNSKLLDKAINTIVNSRDYDKLQLVTETINKKGSFNRYKKLNKNG